MNCAEFHKALPLTIESGGNLDEQEHLKSCPRCSDLVNDLRYIADQAKLLLPMHDPSPRVWENIQSTLRKEGFAKSDRMPRLGHIISTPKSNQWLALGWATTLAATLLVMIALFQYLRPPAESTQSAQVNAQSTASSSPVQTQQPQGSAQSEDDNQLLSEVEQHSPALKPVYESNLRNVNNYISDARNSVQQDPDDTEAQDHLRQAYAQKAMLYQMATARSLQ